MGVGREKREEKGRNEAPVQTEKQKRVDAAAGNVGQVGKNVKQRIVEGSMK